MALPPIKNPARFVPLYGVGYSGSGGELNPVSSQSPLPVTFTEGTALPVSLEGSATDYLIAGPWLPARGFPILIQLQGDWQGSVNVMRSTDSGASHNYLTVGGAAWAQFTANACEAVWEENDPGAELYLEVDVTSGALDYRLGH